MSAEGEFNEFAAGELIQEYVRETGQALSLKRLGDPFPDLILQRPDGEEVGVELVSIVLAFINREHAYFEKYRQAFLASVQAGRPRYRRVKITLQPHADRERPIQLPDIKSQEGKEIVKDFTDLLDHDFESMSRVGGGNDGGAVFAQLQGAGGALRYPALSEYFSAIMFHHLGAGEPGGVHPDDPFIENPVVWYDTAEIAIAVGRALEGKAGKGPAYSSDLLVLHTLPKPGVPDVSGIGMKAEELQRLGSALLVHVPELPSRFREIWLLNRYITNGTRLYRLR